MDEKITAGMPVSGRVLEAAYPPEPAGYAVALDHRGVAFQRHPENVERGSTRRDALWSPIMHPDMFREGSRTWRQLHAAGPVIVVWEPDGRDRVDAAALASYGKGPDGAA